MTTLLLQQQRAGSARPWGWGERMRARIEELETETARLLAHGRPEDGRPEDGFAEARDRIEVHLRRARTALERPGRAHRVNGGAIDQALSNYHAAYCLLLREMPEQELRGRLPELANTVTDSLPPRDTRRRRVEALLRRSEGEAVTGPEAGTSTLSGADRVCLIETVRAALLEEEREQARIRSFRNLVWSVAAVLTALAIAMAAVAASQPSAVPLCFTPENPSKVVCPTDEVAVDDGRQSNVVLSTLVSRWDYTIVEGVGLIAAAIAAAASLRQIRGTSTPYGVPVALAALKLPTGALTAAVGLLLMRGQFVPGLSALDTPGQIIAWAIVFGYAQQLFTTMVDRRGQALLDTIGGPDEEDSFRRTKLRTAEAA